MNSKGKGSYLDHSQSKLAEAEVSGQEQIRSDLAQTTSSLLRGSCVEKINTPSMLLGPQ